MTAAGIVAGIAVGVLVGRSIGSADGRAGGRHRPITPMRGGQVLMGPQQPRPRPQAHIPAAPPRGGQVEPYAAVQPRVRPRRDGSPCDCPTARPSERDLTGHRPRCPRHPVRHPEQVRP